MFDQQTLNQLHVMRLNGMADAFRRQQEQTDLGGLSFAERFALLVDAQWTYKENRSLQRRLRVSRLKNTAAVEDIDYQTPRGLDRALVRGLILESAWVRQHHNVLLTGPTRPAATATAPTTPAPRNCSANWRWPMPTAVSGACCAAWRKPMCWSWMISPWRR